ncbi:MAG: class I SAM-dependent methyltransferase [Acidimicrobiales bacterium]
MPGGRGPNPWERYFDDLSAGQVLFAMHAREYVDNLAAVVGLPASAVVLDFGCGFGLVAGLLAPKVSEVSLWDASANMRRAAEARVACVANARMREPHDLDPETSVLRFDLILVNSVVQYMTADEFSGWLASWRALLAPGGRLVVSDVVPPGHSPAADVFRVLHFARTHRFLARAVLEAAGDLRRYRRTRGTRPLLQLDRADLVQRAAEAGLATTFIPNLTALATRSATVHTAQ